MRRLFFIVAIVLAAGHNASAGGPKYVAGSSYFDPTTMGTPLTWARGTVTYYTDQGNLSAILPGRNADALVANAFAKWASIPTAAVSAVRAGQLAEDVNGSNVTLVNGALNMPADVQSSATGTPVGIIYDADGSVTDALLGTGASSSTYCAANSAFGGIDNFATTAQFAHAVIIINGNCAATSAQLPDLQYHLARMIGRILGLDWSQANLNVITRQPQPTAADYVGFPLMHSTDPTSCAPVANCYSNNGAVDPSAPKLDDQAALSRLYPITASNLASFPGKQVFAQTTARIHGTVYFTDAAGLPDQGMQGVNVVARWIDPTTGLPSRGYVVTSISGFAFCTNDGNVVTGYTDSNGLGFDRYGSDDTTREGFYDLAGLPTPAGKNTQYQLTFEALDPLWSGNAGPYGSTSQVAPSGTAQPIVVTVSPGSDTQQDILMQNSSEQSQQWYQPTSYAAPARVPVSGNWGGVLSGYGTTDFFQFTAQANRTLSVVVNAVNESGTLSENKVLPVLGMWAVANPGQSPAPAYTPSAFNTTYFAESRLDAQVLQSTTFRLGIADYRGDGRPDYRYNARILYGDSLSPARASVAGGTPLSIQGLGLQSNTAVQAANVAVPVMASSATQLMVNSPAARDGVYDVQLNDAGTGANSTMSGVLTVGAGPGDALKLITGRNSSTAVGGQAASPFEVMVVAPDSVTPVAGASVQFSSRPAVGYSACGAANCTVLTDQSGVASTFMTVLSAGTMTLTATLAPASYSSPQQVQATLVGTSSNLDLSMATPAVWIAQGTAVSIPMKVRVLSNGNPVSGATVNYQIMQGAGTLSAASALTNSNGDASVSLQLNPASTGTQVSVCAAPNNNPCQTFNATVVPLASVDLQLVAGSLQIVPAGQGFQPVVVRVTDSSFPANPVLGAGVFFQSYVGRLPQNQTILWAGEAGVSQPGMPVILSEQQSTVQSDVNGLASFSLSTGGAAGNVAILGSAATGSATVQFAAQQVGP